LKLGFSERVADNILNYRNKGGKFREKGDMKRIYGFDTVLYKEIEDFILIKGKAFINIEKLEINSTDSAGGLC
jgi:transcriptional accessory protein Tex/SPT6